jgi:hypothetical protein
MVLIKWEMRTPGFPSNHTYTTRTTETSRRGAPWDKNRSIVEKKKETTYRREMEMRTPQCSAFVGYAAPAFTWVHLHERYGKIWYDPLPQHSKERLQTREQPGRTTTRTANKTDQQGQPTMSSDKVKVGDIVYTGLGAREKSFKFSRDVLEWSAKAPYPYGVIHGSSLAMCAMLFEVSGTRNLKMKHCTRRTSWLAMPVVNHSRS